jgi:hypothetical protein
MSCFSQYIRREWVLDVPTGDGVLFTRWSMLFYFFLPRYPYLVILGRSFARHMSRLGNMEANLHLLKQRSVSDEWKIK